MMNNILSDVKNIQNFYKKVEKYINENDISELDSLGYQSSVNHISGFYFDRVTEVVWFKTVADPSDEDIEVRDFLISLINKFHEIFNTIEIENGCIHEYLGLLHNIMTEYYTSSHYYDQHD